MIKCNIKFATKGGLLLLSSAAYCSSVEAAPKSPKQKNVLFIMSDDFNYWLSAIGYYPQVQTPNLDRLASRGVLFTQAYCSSPVSNPSRNALWSGLRPSTTGIDSNDAGYVRDKEGLEDIVTMNQYFLNNGYYVYGAGKLYHPGAMADHDHIDQQYWSERYTGNTGSHGGTLHAWNNPKWAAMKHSVNAKPRDEQNCADFKMVNQVADFIKGYESSANSDKPFFVGCGVFRPHLPWGVPIDFWERYNTEQMTIPKGCVDDRLEGMDWFRRSKAHDGVLEADKWQEAIHAYVSLLTMADDNIGVLLDALDSTKYRDNTIICFMGDHGWHLGEKESWGKATLYDQASHTSLIIYDPAAKGNGKVCQKVVSLQDLYPTLVELCGLPKKSDVEGNNIEPLLNNPKSKSWNEAAVSRYNGSDFIKDNEWRYVRSRDISKRMLFDVQNDPYERVNLYNDSNYRGVIESMTVKMDSIIGIGKQIREDKLKAKR